MRCTYLFVVLAAAGLSGSCKPRQDASRALGEDSGESVELDRSTVKTVIDDSTDGKVLMDNLADFARKWQVWTFAERNIAMDQVNALAAGVLANQKLLQMNLTLGAQSSSTTTAQVRDVEQVIEAYDGLKNTMKPIVGQKFWQNWDGKKSDTVALVADTASAQFNKIAAMAQKWVPKTPPTEAKPLTELSPFVYQIEGKSETTNQPQAKVPPVPAGAMETEIEPEPTVESKKKLPPEPAKQPTVDNGPSGGSGGGQAKVAPIPVQQAKPVKDLWLEAKRRAEKLEEDLVSGRFDGQLPSLSRLRNAIDSARQSKGRFCNDGRPNAESGCRGAEIIDLLSNVSQLRELYAEDAGVEEGYTIRQHTERVMHVFLQQADIFGLPKGSNDYDRLLPIVIALHDIGKPVAVRAGNKEKQHEHNAAIAFAMLTKLGFNYTQANIGQTLVGSDALGWIVRTNPWPDDAKQMVQKFADAAKIPLTDYFALARPFYLADACSYPGVRSNFFHRDEGDKRLLSNNGALEGLADAIYSPQKKPPKPQQAQGVVIASGAEVDPFAAEPSGGFQQANGGFNPGMGGMGWAGPMVQIEKVPPQPKQPTAPQPQQQAPQPEKPIVIVGGGGGGSLSPKSFIGSKYSAYSIGVSFYGDREAHLYGEGQGENWSAATWEFEAKTGRIFVRVKQANETYVFETRGTTALVWYDNQGGNIVVPRIRPPQ